MSEDPNQREEFEMRRRGQLDYQSNLAGARQEGKIEGLVETLIELAVLKFGSAAHDYLTLLQQCDENQLKNLRQSILSANSLDEWIASK